MFQFGRGISLSTGNIHRAQDIVNEFPLNDVRLLVATDSSAILGIGDQGYGGLAISIGKLALYTVGGRLSPFHSAPVCLDVGTDRKSLTDDPLYVGARHPRLRAMSTPHFWMLLSTRSISVGRRRLSSGRIWQRIPHLKCSTATVTKYLRSMMIFRERVLSLLRASLERELKEETLADQRFMIYGAGAGYWGCAGHLRWSHS